MTETELRVAWWRDVGTGAAAERVLDGLLARHREPHRRYHTLKHVAQVLGTCDELLAAVAVDDPAAVRLGAWFHDAVYDPRSATNEADSAALAERELTALGQPPARVARVAALVRATAHLGGPGREVAGSAVRLAPDEAVLLDADLAILAARPAVYDAYVAGVRAEYAHVDETAWRAGRAAVVQAFLDRPRLFRTPPMRWREAPARANLAAELAALG